MIFDITVFIITLTIGETDTSLSEAFKKKFDDPIIPQPEKTCEHSEEKEDRETKDDEIRMVLYRYNVN